MKRLRVRVQGTPDYVEDFVSRIRAITHISKISDPYPCRDSEAEISLYLTCYTSYGRQDIDPRNLYEAMLAARQEVQDLEIQLGEAQAENDRLKERLGDLPMPQPGDVVLGGQ